MPGLQIFPENTRDLIEASRFSVYSTCGIVLLHEFIFLLKCYSSVCEQSVLTAHVVARAIVLGLSIIGAEKVRIFRLPHHRYVCVLLGIGYTFK